MGSRTRPCRRPRCHCAVPLRLTTRHPNPTDNTQSSQLDLPVPLSAAVDGTGTVRVSPRRVRMAVTASSRAALRSLGVARTLGMARTLGTDPVPAARAPGSELAPPCNRSHLCHDNQFFACNQLCFGRGASFVASQTLRQAHPVGNIPYTFVQLRGQSRKGTFGRRYICL